MNTQNDHLVLDLFKLYPFSKTNMNDVAMSAWKKDDVAPLLIWLNLMPEVRRGGGGFGGDLMRAHGKTQD